MAGLEALYSQVSSSITSPQDAVVCFIHWEIVKSGYKCVGTGEESQNEEKKSELLPPSWNSNKELYTLRYRSNDEKSTLLLKAMTVDSILIFNLMDSATEKVTDLTVNVSDYINESNLQSFESVFKNTEDLTERLNSSLLPVPYPPNWLDPHNPFGVGRADLDPLSGTSEGMIMDPSRADVPGPGFYPVSDLPRDLPPGAVPPGGIFYPYRPVDTHQPGPDPDPDHDD
ncbi:proteasome inhibitor PI31 subunit-like [Clarias gariepinus]|uniref:proteasome inhibitor PI31 subunit-like n=1 Tax=Clarias gariepinus TaxID=13013 RepID=UPI00234D0236|nr:proteasome inhibitor PI31 subunit-like [Clarias gariepinus]